MKKIKIFNDRTSFKTFIEEVFKYNVINYDKSLEDLAMAYIGLNSKYQYDQQLEIQQKILDKLGMLKHENLIDKIQTFQKDYFSNFDINTAKIIYIDSSESLQKFLNDVKSEIESDKPRYKNNIFFIFDDRSSMKKKKNDGSASLLIQKDEAEDTEYRDFHEAIERLETNNLVFSNSEIELIVEVNKISYIYSLKEKRLVNNINLESVTEVDFMIQNIFIIYQIINNIHALVLGAGVSVPSGAKTWEAMIKSFQIELTKQNITSQLDSLGKIIGSSNLINTQLLKELVFNSDDYFKLIIDNIYGNKEELSQNVLLYNVSKLINKWHESRFFRVMTYNFDNYLEQYLDHFFDTIPYNIIFNTKLLDDRLNIYHVHGYLPEKEIKQLSDEEKDSIIFTEDDYNGLYNDAYKWQIVTQLSFFRENICFFIGCGLLDPNIRRLLKMSSWPGKHVAIQSKEKLDIKEQIIATNHFYNLGVRTLWANDFDHYRDIVGLFC